jgi:hypothetical protein
MAGRPATLILGMVFVLLLAGCAQGDTSADTSVAASTSSTTTVAPTADSTTTSTVAATTVTAAATTTTTTAATTTTDPETAAETVVDPDQELPGSFGTVGDLLSLTDIFNIDPLDAQILSYLAVDGDEDALAKQGVDAGIWASVTITYSGDITIWDFDGEYRVVQRGDESFYLDEDGSWNENDGWEWPPIGPSYEWIHAQGIAPGCLELGAEVVGLEEIAGATTLHIRCTFDEEGQGGTGFSDVWIGEQGHVMKSLSEWWEDPSFGFIDVWEVTGLDVEPSGPLPPGW